jgi:hypothetical protein
MKSATLSPAARALIEERRKSSDDGARIPRLPDAAAVPLTLGQQMMWLSTEMEKSTAPYNRCSAFHVRGRSTTQRCNARSLQLSSATRFCVRKLFPGTSPAVSHNACRKHRIAGDRCLRYRRTD